MSTLTLTANRNFKYASKDSWAVAMKAGETREFREHIAHQLITTGAVSIAPEKVAEIATEKGGIDIAPEAVKTAIEPTEVAAEGRAEAVVTAYRTVFERADPSELNKNNEPKAFAIDQEAGFKTTPEERAEALGIVQAEVEVG